MKYYITVFLKGLLIGGTLVVPGVSGGSMAMILGIYEQLVHSFNVATRLHGEKKKSYGFLLSFCCGAVLGILILSGIVIKMMNLFPTRTAFFFIGAVAGGVPVIAREIKIKKFRWFYPLLLLQGFAIVFLLQLIPSGIFVIKANGGFMDLLFQCVGGFITAVALVLPGISVSHMLLILGIYESLMQSVAAFQFISLIPFVIGASIGLLLTARKMDCFFEKRRNETYLLILGFVFGSVIELVTSVHFYNVDWVSFLTLIAGFGGVYFVFKKCGADA